MEDEREIEIGSGIEIAPPAGIIRILAARGQRLVAWPVQGDGSHCEQMVISTPDGRLLATVASDADGLLIELAHPGAKVLGAEPGVN